MARTRSDEPLDLSRSYELTAGAIARLACPAGKEQAFLRDSLAPGLAVRVTFTGAKSFVFETKLDRRTIRKTIGDVRAWKIDDARTAANRLRVEIDNGTDPREAERAKARDRMAALRAERRAALTVGDVWPTYLAKGKPKRRDAWKPRYRAELEAFADAGGKPRRKHGGGGETRPGALFPLMSLPLDGITEEALQTWFEDEARRSRHVAARALMMFRGFLRWASAQPEYKTVVRRDVGMAPAILEQLPQTKVRTDALSADMLAPWVDAVEQLESRTVAAYFVGLLLTGARREELGRLQWSAVDFRWRTLTLADKYEATRTIPLTPYLAARLETLPRLNDYVFASSKGAEGHIVNPTKALQSVNERAGVPHLTIHGLRRTHAKAGEALRLDGPCAQIEGHKPSGTHEKYKPRTLDELRPLAAEIEAYILKTAGVEFEPNAAAKAKRSRLRAVA